MIRKTKHLYIGKFLVVLRIALLNLFVVGYAQTNNGSFADYGTTETNPTVAAPTTTTTNTTTNSAPGNGVVIIPTVSTCSYNTCISSCAGNKVCEEKCLSCSDADKVICEKQGMTYDKELGCMGPEYTVTAKKTVAPGDQTVMGITMGPTCLKNGQCGFNIYELLGINKNTSATLFVQDILLSATFFIGTILTIALLYSGVMFIMAGATGKEPTSAKNGIKYSIIGLLIVVTSYSLIRLIQYIAKGL